MKIKEILPILEEMAPLAYAEDFDNVGLLVGNKEQIVTGILVCHDALEVVLDEAIAKQCNLVVCFHPIVFTGLKKITGSNYVERVVMKAIQHQIAIYAVHTALDNHHEGVNRIFCSALGLEKCNILIPKSQFIIKMVVYTPSDQAEKLREALFAAGAGNIGNYERCSFNTVGLGTFKGNANSKPVVGSPEYFIEVEETKIEVVFEKNKKQSILQTLFETHVYEEVAYELYELENTHQNIGMGMIGSLPKPMDEQEFLLHVKQAMQTPMIRHTEFRHKPIHKVAVLGGSGSFAIKNAIQAGADAFLTADLKYHNFYEAEYQLLLADIGHYESERYTKNYIVDFLRKKILSFAIILSEANTNPVKYL
jgi:dinuclear metal center YbgI/SA1388 family protein